MSNGGEKKDVGVKMWKVLIPSTLIPIIIGTVSYFQAQAVNNYKMERFEKRIEEIEKYNPALMDYKLTQIYNMVEKIEKKISR